MDSENNFSVSQKRERLDDEGVPTLTSKTQVGVEASVQELYDEFLRLMQLDPEAPELRRTRHIEYLTSYLVELPGFYEGLDCSRAWLCYWITHSLLLLNYKIEDDIQNHIIDFLSRCQSEDGGFGGGPGQLPHLAATYAAVNTLCTLGSTSALEIINRSRLVNFLWSLRVGDGSFFLHIDGEVDIRSVYCALVVAKLTNVYSESLFENSAEWVTRCQTYEGGFSSIPGMEAHGGYSFCGLASLYLLSCPELCDIKNLLRWTANRQMKFEGGFQGRTNKLVDGCYSFWQGATMSLLFMVLLQDADFGINHNSSWHFNIQALQEFILICCQDKNGGLTDKPKVPRDPYHTCYVLSGLSVAQHMPNADTQITGTLDNLLEPINPVYNLGIDALRKSRNYFSQFKKPTSTIS